MTAFETWFDAGLAALSLLAGLALRLAYILRASPYIDEFTTIWAAQQVLRHGLPRLPTGAVYTQGLLYTYLDAAALTLSVGFSPLAARLPSLLLSILTLALLVYAARRLFHARLVGFAALWLALDAQAVLWGGRARTYALLQFLVLLAFLAWYHGAVDGDRPRARWLAIGLFLLALVDQPLVLLLLPPLALLALWARGWGWLRQPVVWLQAGAVVIGAAARWLLYGLMVPPGATPSAAPRAFVDLHRPLAAASDLLVPFLTAPNRLLPTLLIGGGLVWLLLRGRGRQGPPWKRPFLTLLFLLAGVWLEFLLAVGVSWRAPRYLYPLLPFFFLAAEGVIGGLWSALADRRWRWLLPVGMAVLIAAGGAGSGLRLAMGRDEWGYDRALAVVEAGWTEGDALATIAPAAAFAQLGHCDYLAVEEGAQLLLIESEGRQVDGWTGLPLLDSPQRLAEALDAHPHLWFVADEMRLNRHFSPDYLRLLWDRSDLTAFEKGVFVFRSRPAEPPPAVDRSWDRPWAGPVLLDSFALSDDRPQPGQTLTVTLRWRSGEAATGAYTAFVHLVNRREEGVAGRDAPLLGGLYPLERWPRSDRSQPFPDRYPLALPADLPPDRYRLDVGLYDSHTLEPVGPPQPLDFLRLGGYQEERPPGPPLAQFGEAATLYLGGLEGELRPGGQAVLRLVWQTGPAGLDDDYTLFLHLLDAQGQIAQQFDAPPVEGWFPTSYWHPGEVVSDTHRLAFEPDLEPGVYRLVGGLYRADGRRLPLSGGGDTVEIAVIELADGAD